MNIDSKKLPIKYLLNVYKDMPGFPLTEDLIYMILSNLNQDSENFTSLDIWPYVKDGFGTMSDLNDFLIRISDENNGIPILKIVKESSNQKKENIYKVINNPWN